MKIKCLRSDNGGDVASPTGTSSIFAIVLSIKYLESFIKFYTRFLKVVNIVEIIKFDYLKAL